MKNSALTSEKPTIPATMGHRAGSRFQRRRASSAPRYTSTLEMPWAKRLQWLMKLRVAGSG